MALARKELNELLVEKIRKDMAKFKPILPQKSSLGTPESDSKWSNRARKLVAKMKGMRASQENLKKVRVSKAT